MSAIELSAAIGHLFIDLERTYHLRPYLIGLREQLERGVRSRLKE